MRKTPITKVWASTRYLALALLCVYVGVAQADDTATNSSASLRAKYDASQKRLSNNQFQRPLFMDSSETPGGVTGDIYALVNHPFAMVGAALNDPNNWCDILSLHLNTKYCHASTSGQGNVLDVMIGKKYDQPLKDAYRVVFAYRVAAQTTEYLQVKLSAGEGPLSTRDYRILFEAVPLKNGQTFIHLSYSYSYGLVGRLAMQAYLGTAASDKVGFTAADKEADGQSSRYVGGIRGVVERNTMRYYLAIEAFLDTMSGSPQARLEKRLNAWFTASELYPRQLHEMDQRAYLDMKRREYRRQQMDPP